MPSAPSRSTRQLSTIAQASPFVITQRLMDMAWATQPPSGRDQREWNRMVAEKGSAAMKSWWGMVNAMWLAPFSAGLWSAWSPWSSPWQRWTGLAHAGDRILAEGLKPVARTVSANRTRLAKRAASRR
ncbi:hypothetical protein [Lysobacter sp. CA199]|uniref:hypothetical protein n=1 Tax=Lysobacter sp. CA199 TaxID=3455608 RepID=UPI003F8D25BE